MSSHARNCFLAAMTALLFIGVVHLRADAPASQPSSSKAFVPAFAAMQYYDDNCAHCHGPQGSFYGPTIGNDLTDDGLIAKCHAMAVGPGAAPISDDENLVLTAYHRALILRTPFLSVTDISANQWSGEVSPGGKVSIHFGNSTIEAAVTGCNWKATLPVGTKLSDVSIQVDLHGKQTTLKPALSAYSHTTPLPPQDQRHK